MKSKLIITLTALLMLGGISAMARGSFPKGDINEDGVVNAADIVALANIIMNGEEPSGEAKYYWYAGTTLPTADNIASIALGSSNTIERWNGKEFLVTNTGSVATPVYVCTPVDFYVIWKDPNGFDINLPEVTDARFTYNGVEYKVQKKGRDLAAGAEFAVNGYYSDSETPQYYWYAGLTLPTADNIASIALGSSNTIEKWDGKEFNITNSGTESTPAYVCTPVDFKVSWKDMNGFTLNLVEVEGAGFTLNGVEYIVQRRGRVLSAGATFTVRGYYTDSDVTGVSQVPAQAVLIQSEGGLLTVQGLDDGTEVSVYGVNGTEAGAAVSRNGQAQVNTNLSAGSIAIVKIGDKSVKVVIK